MSVEFIYKTANILGKHLKLAHSTKLELLENDWRSGRKLEFWKFGDHGKLLARCRSVVSWVGHWLLRSLLTNPGGDYEEKNRSFELQLDF